MTEKHSILIISQHFPPERSGNASRIYDMACNLTTQGVNVHVISPFPTFPTGTFPRTWKKSSDSRIHGIDVTNLWAWQPISKDPGFVSRMCYYLLFPQHLNLSLDLLYCYILYSCQRLLYYWCNRLSLS